MFLNETKERQLASESKLEALKRENRELSRNTVKLEQDREMINEDKLLIIEKSEAMKKEMIKIEIENKKIKSESDTNEILIISLKEQLKVI